MMNLQDIAIVCGLCTTLLVPAGTAGKYWADHTYITIASQNLKLLYAVEDEMEMIQRKIENGTATSTDLQRMATLKERKRHLIE